MSAPSAVDAAAALDLDGPGPATAGRAPHRRRLLALALAVCAVAGGAGGAASSIAARTPPEPPPVRVRSSATVEGGLLLPGPAALLHLTLMDADTAQYVVDHLVVSGGGAVPGALAAALQVAPGETDSADVAVPLRCAASPDDDDRTPLRVQVRLRRLTTSGPVDLRTVDAVTLGSRPDAGGLCAAVDPVLPAGWRTPARATARWTPSAVDLDVTGLPAQVDGVLEVTADGVRLPVTTATVAPGTAHLVLAAPASGCSSGGLPTGLQLLLRGPDPTPLRAYLPLGTALAAWLDAAGAGPCATPGRRGG